MTETRIKREIALGSIVNLAVILAGLAAGWGMMSERSTTTSEALTEVRETLRQETLNRRDATASLEARIRALESSQARSDERLSHILQALGRIEVQLEGSK